MSGIRLWAIVLVVLLVGFVPQRADATTSGWTFDLSYWRGNASGSSPGGQFGSWSTDSWGLAFTYQAPRPSRWGYYANFLTGTQRTGTGSWSMLQSGTDTHWVSQVTYLVTPPGQTPWVAATAGWGGFNWSSGFNFGSEAFWSKGFNLGVAFYAPLGQNFDYGGRIDFFPSNYTRLASGGAESTSNGSAWRGMFRLTYEQDPWSVSVGYQYMRANAGDVTACPSCYFTWSGFFVSAGFQR